MMPQNDARNNAFLTPLAKIFSFLLFLYPLTRTNEKFTNDDLQRDHFIARARMANIFLKIFMEEQNF